MAAASSPTPTTSPTIDDMLRRAFDDVENDDVRLFYAYFDELKAHVRKYLHGKARVVQGETNVAQSALFSMFCDVAIQQIPLQDVDEDGMPMLWPLLLKYIERHCEKWKKYFRAKKRKAAEVPLASPALAGAGFDVADYRSPADEDAVGAALAELYEKLTPRQRRIADLSAAGSTLEQIATEVDCSESLVSLEKKAIRRLLETA